MSNLKDRRIILLKELDGSYRVANHNIWFRRAGAYWIVQEYDTLGDLKITDRFTTFKRAKSITADRLGL